MKQTRLAQLKKIGAVAILSVFVFGGVAQAQQTPAPTPTPPGTTPQLQNVIVDKAMFTRGQTDGNYCKTTLHNAVLSATLGQFKTNFSEEVGTGGNRIPSRCYIVPSGASTGLVYEMQPSGSKDITQQIINNGQIDKATIAANVEKDSKELAEAGPGSRFIGWVLTLIFDVIAWFLSWLAALAAYIMDVAINATLNIDYTSINVVNNGWAIVRDFANMFFIIIMIVIALGAILRIEKLDYRHLLPELVIMAILVNFSKVIAVTIIDIANIAGLVFYTNGFQDVYAAISRIVDLKAVASGTTPGWQAALGQGIGKVLFMLVATASFVALAGMFIIRVIGLYVFIIFSPMYFVLDILPGTKEFAHKFQHKFIEYVVWVPVALLMLRITMLIADRTGRGLDGITNIAGGPTGVTGAPAGSNINGESFFTYFILIGFMWATVLIAEHAGMVGGKAIAHAVEHAGHSLSHAASGYAGRKWNDYTSHKIGAIGDKGPTWRQKALFTALNPVASLKGLSDRAHEKDHIASSYALATGKEVWGGRGGTPYRTFLAQKEEIEMSKEYNNLSPEGKIKAMLSLKGAKGHEAAVRRRALLRSAGQEQELEDLAFAAEFTTNGGVTNADLGRFMRSFTESGHDRESVRFIEQDMTNIGKKELRANYVGHSGTSENIEEQLEAHRKEVKKWEGQQRARAHPGNFGAIWTKGGYVYGGAENGAINSMDQSVLSQANRIPERTAQIMIPGEKVILEADAPTVIVDNKEQADRIMALAKDNMDAAKTMVAMRMGQDKPNEYALRMTGFKVRINNTTDVRTTTEVNSSFVPGVKPKSAEPTPNPIPEPPRVILTDERENPVDSDGNPIRA